MGKDFKEECKSAVIFVDCPRCDKRLNFEAADKIEAHCWGQGGCQHAFCRLCKEPWVTDGYSHAVFEDCDAYEKKLKELLDPANQNAQSLAFIEAHTKPCPACNTPIQKNGGCDHITCTSKQKDCTRVVLGMWTRVALNR